MPILRPPTATTTTLTILLTGLLACAGDDGDSDSAASLNPTGASGLATTQDVTSSGSDSDTNSSSDAGTASNSDSNSSESESTSTSDTSGVSATDTDTSTTDASGSSGSSGSTTDDTATDATTTGSTTGSTTDDTTTDSGDQCIECGVTLDSTQSSSFIPLQGTEFIGSATLEDDKIIYALDEVGSGRVVYTADTNILYKEITDCPLWEWLGDSGDQLPKVLSFGRNLCGGLGNNLGNYPDLTYAGTSLPQEYVGDPAKLAADYDLVIYCATSGTNNAEAATIVDYVKDQSGGLYLASEYFGFLKQADVDRINTIGNPLGVNFETTNLDWGQASGEIGFSCFPAPQ